MPVSFGGGLFGGGGGASGVLSFNGYTGAIHLLDGVNTDVYKIASLLPGTRFSVNWGVPVAATTTKTTLASFPNYTVYTNEGAGGTLSITLPPAAASTAETNQMITVYVRDPYLVEVTAGTGDTIRIGQNVTAAAGTITSNVVGSLVTLIAINATEWVAMHYVETWGF